MKATFNKPFTLSKSFKGDKMISLDNKVLIDKLTSAIVETSEKGILTTELNTESIKSPK